MSGKLVAKKAANYLSQSVQLRPAIGGMLQWSTLGTPDVLLKWFRGEFGGLWVGGTLFVYEHRVSFQANAFNKAIQDGNLAFELNWIDITEIRWRPGLLTSIIKLRHAAGTEAVRCFGSRQLSAKMTSLREKAANHP